MIGEFFGTLARGERQHAPICNVKHAAWMLLYVRTTDIPKANKVLVSSVSVFCRELRAKYNLKQILSKNTISIIDRRRVQIDAHGNPPTSKLHRDNVAAVFVKYQNTKHTLAAAITTKHYIV